MAKRYSEETIALDAYAPAPYNPRTISKHDMANLQRSIERWGDLENVVVNKRTGHIVSGHQRVEAAKAAGLKDFRAVVIDVNEDEEKLINLAMNRVRGEWDEPGLGALLGELGELPGVDVSLAGFGESELSALTTRFDPVSVQAQARLDEKAKVKCPECGHEFTP